MPAEVNSIYEFGPFRIDTKERLLLQGTEPLALPPKAFDLLVVLVKNSGQLVTRDELRKNVWPDSIVEEGNINLYISLIRKTLKKADSGSLQYVKTISRHGYRFIASVREVPDEEVKAIGSYSKVFSPPRQVPPTADDNPDVSQRSQFVLEPEIFISPKLNLFLGGHLWHVLIACVLYASLYAVAVQVEIAYQFNLYGARGLNHAMAAFWWMFLTSFAGLAADWNWTIRGRKSGFWLPVIVFLLAAAAVIVGMSRFLPSISITQAIIQTQTAQAAYLKSACYFIPLALFFLILPFHFVITAQRELLAKRCTLIFRLLTAHNLGASPVGAIYIKPWLLLLLLVLMLIVGPAFGSRLLENLKVATHMNLFMVFYFLRLFLYFTLGAECLIWYYRVLNDIKLECLTTEGN